MPAGPAEPLETIPVDLDLANNNRAPIKLPRRAALWTTSMVGTLLHRMPVCVRDLRHLDLDHGGLPIVACLKDFLSFTD